MCTWGKKYKGHGDNSTMISLWDPWQSLLQSWIWFTLIFAGVQLKFAMIMDDPLDVEIDTQFGLPLLAINVLLKGLSLTYMFRLTVMGSRIHAICSSFMGGATKEMMFVAIMTFFSFSMSFLVLARGKDITWLLASSYRGLLFGDSDGFNNLGFSINEAAWYENDKVLLALMLIGSFFFNLIILNLIIAIYGNEYDKVESMTPLLFQQGRAQNCALCILSYDMFKWKGHKINLIIKLVAWTLFLTVGFLSFAIVSNSYWVLAFVMATSQVLLMAAMSQSEWYSAEGTAADGKDRFLWICSPTTPQDIDTDDFSASPESEEHVTVQMFEHRMQGLEQKLEQVLKALQPQQARGR